MKKPNPSKSFTPLALCLCLFIVSTNLVPSIVATGAGPATRPDAAEEAAGARQFDEAVNELERILSLDLTTEQGARESSKILEKNVKKLALADKKALHAGRKVSAFSEGIKAEAGKRKGGMDELVREVKADPGKVMGIPGAQEAAATVQGSTRRAGEVLEKVSAAFRKAADSLKEKQPRGGLRGGGVLLRAGYARPGEATGAAARNSEVGGASIMYLNTGMPPALNPTQGTNCTTNPACLTLFFIVTGLRLTIARFQQCSAGINNAFNWWNSCRQTRWWDIVFCNDQFLYQVKQACSFI